MVRRLSYGAVACGVAAAALCAVIACAGIAAPALAQSVTSAPPPTENLLGLQQRVSDLEQLLQRQTSENERLSIELRRTRADNERLQKLLNDALAQQGGGASAPPAPLTPLPPSSPQQTGQIGTLPPDALPAGDPAQQLRDAMRFLQMGRYADAESAFAAFVRANPQSPDTPEARYFIGRTQVAQRRFDDAAATFVGLLRDLPSAPRAPDAWTMLGVSLKGMGKTAEACGVFHDLPVKYPRASASTRNTAAAEARDAHCS